jgi:hypothetical protein
MAQAGFASKQALSDALLVVPEIAESALRGAAR